MKLTNCTTCNRSFWAQTTKAEGKRYNEQGAYLGCAVPSMPKKLYCLTCRPKTPKPVKVKIKRIKKHKALPQPKAEKKGKGRKGRE